MLNLHAENNSIIICETKTNKWEGVIHKSIIITGDFTLLSIIDGTTEQKVRYR